MRAVEIVPAGTVVNSSGWWTGAGTGANPKLYGVPEAWTVATLVLEVTAITGSIAIQLSGTYYSGGSPIAISAAINASAPGVYKTDITTSVATFVALYINLSGTSPSATIRVGLICR